MALITMYVMGACQRRQDNIVLVVIFIRGAIQFVVVRQPAVSTARQGGIRRQAGICKMKILKIVKNSGLEQPWLETVLFRGFEVCSPFIPEKQFVCFAMYPFGTSHHSNSISVWH